MKTTETANSLTITLSEREHAILKRFAEAMNRTPWADSDNTPATVFREFVWTSIVNILTDPGAMAENILDGIATGANGTDVAEPEHSRRIAEMRAKFEEAGLLGRTKPEAS